jgi:AraC family transcriptional regulator, regulatory protein of adaptative response / methylated-DNA-[protein]-cysteine methyltransferase
MPKDSPSPELQTPTAGSKDYVRIERAIEFLISHREAQPSLEAVASHVGLSPFHLQRLFTRWAGVSPKKFLSYLTVEHAKQRLEDSASVLEAAFETGLSGPSRLHDLMVSVEAMTPGEYKAQGSALVIRTGIAPTPFGDALFLVSDRGLCGLEFLNNDLELLIGAAHDRWPLSRFVKDNDAASAMAQRIFGDRDQVSVLMKGTPWQLQVWSALLRIPPGSISSYGQIAEVVCTKNASRAVGTAVAANHIGYVVPCHRVLRSTGLFKRFRWGAPRRWAMLARESHHA